MMVRVGPALVAAAANTAGRPRHLAELARTDMENLGRLYAAQGAASLAVGEEIVLIETYNPGNQAGTPMRVGNRVPLASRPMALFTLPGARTSWLAGAVPERGLLEGPLRRASPRLLRHS